MVSTKKSWQVELSASASKQLKNLDRQIQHRILAFLTQRVASLDNPRSIGSALRGEQFGNFWKYRVGDYRIIADIQDTKLIVLVLTIGHRREIYR
ncbi:MAG TPA: type II toxin-antitoxin system RelE/ParE family toxin [Candidatus Angelobacter sp.]|nr:type II toxin-antitoxin system RelE/ParE family toxin [Candidatus Angelobacter sp.]